MHFLQSCTHVWCPRLAWGWWAITYQSITVTDGHWGLRHVRYIPGKHTVSEHPLFGLFLKILLPLNKSSRGHESPVGPQAQVQLFSKHRDVEEQLLPVQGRVRRNGGVARDPFPAGRWRSRWKHVRHEPAARVRAERDHQTEFTQLTREIPWQKQTRFYYWQKIALKTCA